MLIEKRRKITSNAYASICKESKKKTCEQIEKTSKIEEKFAWNFFYS